MTLSRRTLLAAAVTAGTLAHLAPTSASAATAKEIDAQVDVALRQLLDSNEAARILAKDAKGILVFPDVIKAGLIIGGSFGDGALRKGGRTEGYYRSVSASYGLQAGAESFGYALFLMTDDAVTVIEQATGAEGGWEIGVGPTVVVADQGLGAKLSTTTAREGIYAFIFGQQGLMAGLGIEGSKVTKFTPES
jgi:lipid-binding SYLF domain-containing protein